MGFHLIPWVLVAIALFIETCIVRAEYNVPTAATVITYQTVEEQVKRIALMRTRVLSDGDDGPCEERVTEEEYGPPRTVTKDVEVAVFSSPDFQKFIRDMNVLSQRYDEIVCSPVGGDGTLFYVLKLHLDYGGRNVKRVWQYRGKLRGCLKFVSNVLSTAVCLPFVPFDLISFLPLPITALITQVADGVLSFLSELVVFIITLIDGINAQLFRYFFFAARIMCFNFNLGVDIRNASSTSSMANSCRTSSKVTSRTLFAGNFDEI